MEHRLFVLHTQAPRVMAEVQDDYSLALVPGWGDPLPAGPERDQLLQEMARWFAAELDQAAG